MRNCSCCNIINLGCMYPATKRRRHRGGGGGLIENKRTIVENKSSVHNCHKASCNCESFALRTGSWELAHAWTFPVESSGMRTTPQSTEST